MSNLIQCPLFYSVNKSSSDSLIRGVADPDGDILASRIDFGVGLNDGPRFILNPTPVDANTDYTIKFQARHEGVGDSFSMRIAGNVTGGSSGFVNQGFTVSGQWAEYEHTFNTGDNTELDATSRFRNNSEHADLVVDFTYVRLYKTSEGDPFELPSGGNVYETDFSGDTTNQEPSGWTRRYEAVEAWTVREGGSYEGGKYLEHDKASTGRNALSKDDVSTDAHVANGTVQARFFMPTGEAGEWNFLLRGSGGDGTEDLVRPGVTGSGPTLAYYSGGSFESLTSEIEEKTAVSPNENEFWSLRVRYILDAIIFTLWDDSLDMPENPTHLGGVPLIFDGSWTGLFKFGDEEVHLDTFAIATGNATLDAQPLSGTVSLEGQGESDVDVIVLEADDESFTNATIFEIVQTDLNGDWQTTENRDPAKEYIAFAHKSVGGIPHSSQAKFGEE